MARLNNLIRLSVDEFIKASRIDVCEAFDCKYHDEDSTGCNLKKIILDENGKCKLYER